MARLAANLAAIGVIQALQAESRPATPAEQGILAGWSGWGAVAQVFPKKHDEESPFPAQHAELQALLTEREYDAARRTVINAHYTSPAIARAMWEGLAALGFSGGRVLEPGCGAGTFIGLAPLGTAIVGVELDPVTARIAAALYPHARIRCESFADTTDREGTYDAAIGNVPFGSIHLNDPRYNPARRYPIHTHFILKAAALTRPGGLIAVITSRYTMDGKEPPAVEARRQLAGLGELAAAVRLPGTAHRRTAGTSVVTDVLVIRRFEDGETPPAAEPAWVQTTPVDVSGQQITINRHFADRPDMVLGELGAGGARRADDLQVTAPAGFDVAAGLADALTRAAGRQAAAPPPAPARQPDRWQLAQPPDGYQQARPDGSFTRTTRHVHQVEREDGTTARWVTHDPDPFTPPGSPAEHRELRALLAIRDTALELLDAEMATSEDAGLVDSLRTRLNDRYDSYVAAYGPVNRYTPQFRVRRSPEGQALREQLLADGRARLAGGTVEITDPAARQQLITAGHAVETGDGGLRLRQTARARAARQRLVDTGQAQVTGASLQITDAGKAWILDNIAGLDDAVTIIRARPGQGGFRNDPYAARVQALERYDPETGTVTKRDVMHHRVLLPRPDVEHAEDPKDALAICMDRHGQVRLDVIAGLLGAASDDEARNLLGDLVFPDPGQDCLVPASMYLSGDVREKLRRAQAAAETNPSYQANVEALTAIIPEDLGPADISARLGAVFITGEQVEQFLRETLLDESVTTRFAQGKWEVATGNRTSVAATITWGTKDRDALHLAENLLNRGAPVEVKRTDADGKTWVDEEATLAAREKQAELSDRFAGWVWEDLDRAREVCRRYNDTFNATVLCSYDDLRLTLPGVNKEITPFWWQHAAIGRMIYEPTALLGHDMGAGKTLEQIIGVMEQKRLGLIRKPVIVVKNHLLEQFRDEFLWAYPQARIMCADGGDLAGDGRRNFIARAAAENPDAIIMTQRAFESIPLTREGHEAYLAYMLKMFEIHAEDAAPGSVKDQVTLLTEFEEKLRSYFDPDYAKDDDDQDEDAGQRPAIEDASAAAGPKKKKKAKKRIEQDPVLCWEELGIDYVVIDESQDYNNLWVPSAEPGMAIGFVHRSIDLEMKLHASRARYGSRVATFATGTPVTNKIPQYYVLMRYLNPERLQKAGFVGYAPWAATYTEPEQRLEMKASGQFGLVTRMRLINIPELLLDLHQFGDFKDADDIGLPRPAIRGGHSELRGNPGPPELYDWQATLPERYNEARKGGKKQKGDDTVVAVLGDGFHAGQDLRLIHPKYGATPDPATEPQKVDYLAADIFAEWTAARDLEYPDSGVRGGLQLVFCNVGVPKAGQWNLYEELRDLLTAKGMPRRMVRFIHDATDARKKSELFAACNAGHVAVLVTSTEKGGVGLNVQRRCIGVHHFHPHWRPDYGAQEDARARRPGNLNAEVFIKWWLTERSFDTTRAQSAEMKAVFLRVLKHRDPTVRTIEVPADDQINYATMAAISAGEPRLMQKAELESALRQLVRAQRRHGNDQNALKVAEQQARAAIADAEQILREITAAETRLVPTGGDAFAMTIGTTRYTSRRDAGERLRVLLLDAHRTVPGGTARLGTAIGQIGGFELTADLSGEKWREHDIVLRLTGLPGGIVQLHHSELPGGSGIVTRLENKLAGLGKQRDEQNGVISHQRQEISRAHAAIGAPFPQQQALEETKTALDALIAELRTDNADEDTAGTDPAAGQDGSPGPAAGPPAPGGGSPGPAAGAAVPAGYQAARADVLEVLGAGPRGGVPDAAQFADFFARRYGGQDPAKRPLVMQVYADVWLPGQPDDHPLKRATPSPAPSPPPPGPGPAAAEPAGPGAAGGDWLADHPLAGDIEALFLTALADRDLALIARDNSPDNFALVFWNRIAELVIGTAGGDGTGTPAPFEDAWFADPSLAAAVTADLASRMYQAHASPERREKAAAGGGAAGRALRDWTAIISSARAAQCGCGRGCADCALPRGHKEALHVAVTADLDLARAGIRITRPAGAATGPGRPYTRTITWDDTARAYSIDVTGPDGSRFHLLHLGADGDWQVQAGDAPPISLPGTGTRPETRPAAVRYLLDLLPPAGVRLSPPQVLELAARHGLIADPNGYGVVFIRQEPGPGARYALRQEQAGEPLMNRTGRIIPAGRASAYLAAWTADPDASPDQLYAQAIPDTGNPPAGEHSCARDTSHHARDDAASRARDTGQDHYLYPDGRAAVAAARPPARAAYYAVSPAGQWTRHMHGTTEIQSHPPNHGALSVVAGETAARPPAAGPPPDSWTAGHPHAAQITQMRDAALAESRIVNAARNSDLQNYTVTFTAWAGPWLARTSTAHLLAAAAGDAGPPPWALAFQHDHAFTADLTATLAGQVRQQLGGDPAPAGPGKEAVTAAARTWSQQAEKTRASAHGCEPGCRECPPPGSAYAALEQATTIDMHLARTGIPHTQRAVMWNEDTVTWAVTVTEGTSRWQLLAGTGGRPLPVTRDGADTGQLPAAPAATTARRFRALIVGQTGQDAAAGTAQAAPAPAQSAGQEVTADALRALGARHGLITTPEGPGDAIAVRAGLPNARPALSLQHSGLVNGNGRPVPGSHADRYLAAYAAHPRTDPDLLYAEVVAGTAVSAGTEPAERAFWHGWYHHARDHAATRARDTAATWYVYSDGRAYVTTGQMPAQAAYCSVTAGGQWTCHLDGTASPLPGLPAAHDFSALAAAPAGPGPADPPAAGSVGTPARPDAGPHPAAAPDDRMTSFQELAAQHGLTAGPGNYDEEILIRSPHGPAGHYVLRHRRPGEPVLNEDGRIIPLPRAGAYLAAYAAAPHRTPDQLYAQAIPRDPAADAAPDPAEHAFPRRASNQAAADAARRARETGTSHHLYRDWRAIVSTPRQPARLPYYTVSPDGSWTGSPATLPVTSNVPAPQELTSLTGQPGPAAGQTADIPDPQAAGTPPAAAPVPAGDHGTASPLTLPAADPGPAIGQVTVLRGHVSQDTAFLIGDYPYGRRLRCRMRVWIEGPAEKGQYKGQYRVVRQTDNPKLGSRPWNNPHKEQYADWIVMYRDEASGHVETHSGSLTYGLSGPQDARMRLDGTYSQLSAGERKIYDLMVRIGQRADRWEHWHKALDFIRAHHAEHGTWPGGGELGQARSFHLNAGDYDIAVAAARDLPAGPAAAANPAQQPASPAGSPDTQAATPPPTPVPAATPETATAPAGSQNPPQTAAGAGDITAGQAAAPPAETGGLILEHGADGTVLRGSTRSDTVLHTLLHQCGFKYSGRLKFWYLPRGWPLDTRADRVREFRAGLTRLGRGWAEPGNPPAAATAPAATSAESTVPATAAADHLHEMLAAAVTSGDPEQVLRAAHAATAAWGQPGALWPDNWREWQQALDDMLPAGRHIALHDLAGAAAPHFDRQAASAGMRMAWDLGHLPADQVPGAAAALDTSQLGETCDLLGFQSPGHGIDFGPNAGLAYQACTRELQDRTTPGTLPASPEPALKPGTPEDPAPAAPEAQAALPAGRQGNLDGDPSSGPSDALPESSEPGPPGPGTQPPAGERDESPARNPIAGDDETTAGTTSQDVIAAAPAGAPCPDPAGPPGTQPPDPAEPAPEDNRVASLQELADRHGLAAKHQGWNDETVIYQQAPYSSGILRQERPGGPLLDETGRVIPAARADAYLTAWRASADGRDTDQLYAQTATGPEAAAGERAFPLSSSGSALHAAVRAARESGISHHIYGDGRALVVTGTTPAGPPYFTAGPDGHWIGSPGTFPLEGGQPLPVHLTALATDPGRSPVAVPADAAEPAPDPVTEPAPAGTIVIEHGQGGTVIRGTTKGDTEVHALLSGFDFSSRKFWYLPRNNSFDSRNWKVQRLAAGLDRLGRPYVTRDNPLAVTTVHEPLPAAEPYPGLREATAGYRRVQQAYRQAAYGQHGTRLFSRETRDDVAAVKAASEALGNFDLYGPPAPALGDLDATLAYLGTLLEACARTAQVLQANLDAQGRRAPKFRPLLDRFASTALAEAARMAATGPSNSNPPAPAAPGQDPAAAAQPETAPTATTAPGTAASRDPARPGTTGEAPVRAQEEASPAADGNTAAPADPDTAPGPHPTGQDPGGTAAPGIRIDATLRNPVVSGATIGQYPGPLTQALQDSHFSWDDAHQHWEYAGPISGRAQAVTAIREALARTGGTAGPGETAAGPDQATQPATPPPAPAAGQQPGGTAAGQPARPPAVADSDIPEPGGAPMNYMNDADIAQAAARWHAHPILGPATRTLASLQTWADTSGTDGWAAWPAPANAAGKLIELIVRDGTARYAFDDERADATAGELRKAYTPLRRFQTRYSGTFEIEEPQLGTAAVTPPRPAAARAAGATADPAPASSTPAAGGQDGPQQLILAGPPGDAPPGAAGRLVAEHLAGRDGQIWVRDDEGTIWAWPASGGALTAAAAPGAAISATGPAGGPVPGHISGLAGRIIRRSGATARIDPAAPPGSPDWHITFVRGPGEEVCLTVPASLPVTVTQATLARFEISRGSRITTDRTSLPVTASQPVTDAQISSWTEPTPAPPGPAKAPPPGQPTLPPGTRPQPADGAWSGPIHPELPVYQDGTPLAVRFQGPQADQTWHGTAAGVLPAAGDHEPGLLQVITWEPAEDDGPPRHSAVHPAQTAKLTADPYDGLEPRQRHRWQLFDQAAAGGSLAAEIPARLLDPGDTLDREQPGTSTGDLLTAQAVTDAADGTITIEAAGGSGTVTVHHPAEQALTVRIPAARPALAGASSGTQPAPAAPGTGSRAAGTQAAPARPAPGRPPRAESLHDYNRLLRALRAKLDAAVGTGDRDKVIAACREAVTAWNQPGRDWPPDTSPWQDALDQATGADPADENRLLLVDLAAEPATPEPAEPEEPPTLFDLDPSGPDPAAAGNSPSPGGEPGPATRTAAGGTGTEPASAGGTRTAASGPGQDAATAEPGTVPLTNADLAIALQHIAGGAGAAWPVANFLTAGRAPDPGEAHGPGDTDDVTTWNDTGLRRTVSSEQPSRDGLLTWARVKQWIHAGMTSGDVQILLKAGRVALLADGWLDQVRGTAEQEAAFYDAGRGATAILQDCIARVTDAAALAHGPAAPVPAEPPGDDSYRRGQAATTAEHDQVLASVAELSDFTHEAIRQVSGIGPAGKITSRDLAIALKRLHPAELETAVSGTAPVVYSGGHYSRDLGQPDAGASEDVTFTGAGADITIATAGGSREGTVTWPKIAAWLAAGLTPERQGLLRQATTTHTRYYILMLEHSITGTAEHHALASAEGELRAMARSAADAVIDAAAAVHGPGPLPRLTGRRPAAGSTPDSQDTLFAAAAPPPGGPAGPAGRRITELASVLPAWPPAWHKPLFEVQPGDTLKHNGHPFTVTAPLRHGDQITEIDGTLPRQKPGTTTTWRYAHHGNPGAHVEIYPSGGPLTGPVPAPPGQQHATPATAATTEPDAPAAAPASQPAGTGDGLRQSPVTAGSRQAPPAEAGSPQRAALPAGSEIAPAEAGAAASPAAGDASGPDPSAAAAPGPGTGRPDGDRKPRQATPAGLAGPAEAAPGRGSNTGTAEEDHSQAGSCAVCGGPMDPAITAHGIDTHPCCSPEEHHGAGGSLEDIPATATTREIITLAAERGLQPRLDPAADPDGPIGIVIGGPGQHGPAGVIRISRNTGRILTADLTATSGENRQYTMPGSIRAALRAQPGQPAPVAAAIPPAGTTPPGQAPSATQPAPGTAVLDRAAARSREQLHAAAGFLAALPGYAAGADGPGLTAADTDLGLFLADLPAGQWSEQMRITAWAMLGRYSTQLGEAGISYDRLPPPAGAEHMTGTELAATRQAATQEMTQTWPGMLRDQNGPRFARCTAPGTPVMLGYDPAADSDLDRAARQLPGLHGYSTAAQAAMYSFTSLPDVAALAAEHGIPVPEYVRSLAATAARTAPPAATGAGAQPAAAGPDAAIPGQEPEQHPQAASSTGNAAAPSPAELPAGAEPGPQPVTGEDLALALRLMPPDRLALAILARANPGWHQLDGWRLDGEPDAGATQLLEFDRAGARIRIGAPSGTRDRTMTWSQIRGWIQAGLTPARGELLAAAAATRARYELLAAAGTGIPEPGAGRRAAADLDAIQLRATNAIISAALAQHGTGPLPEHMPGPRPRDDTLPLPDPGQDSETAARDMARVAELAAALPAPTPAAQPGDLARPPAAAAQDAVPAAPGPATARPAPPHQRAIAAPVQQRALPAAGRAAVPALRSQLIYARWLAARLEQATGASPLPGSSPPLALPAAAEPPLAGAGLPWPGPVSPLPATTAAGLQLRPGRLVYADHTEVTCRPDGQFGAAWTGVTAGTIPAGDGPGQLQAVLTSSGQRRAVHPALLAPAGVNPYALLPFRQQQRFSVFDRAEAAGRDAAWLPAEHILPGDLVRTETPDGHPAVREVTSVHAAGLHVTVTTAGPGQTRTADLPLHDLTEVLIPARHPAEDGPYAARLFTPQPAARPAPAASPAPATTTQVPDPAMPRLSALEARVADLAQQLADLRNAGTPDRDSGPPAPGPDGDPHDWDAAAASTTRLRHAHAAASGGLQRQRLWTQIGDLAGSARQLARDAARGRLRFTSPPAALIAWRELWAQICDVTSDLAAAITARLRAGSPAWRAARRADHAAAEAAAHARGWLPREDKLPAGSYDPPVGYLAPAWARADAATRLHQAGAGPLSQVEFPGPLAGATARRTPAPRGRRRAARTAAARGVQAADGPGRHP